MTNAALVATAAPDGAGLRSRRGTGREKLSAGQSATRLPCPPNPVHPVVVTAGHQQQIFAHSWTCAQTADAADFDS